MNPEIEQPSISVAVAETIDSINDELLEPLNNLKIKTTSRNMLIGRKIFSRNDSTYLAEGEKAILLETHASFCTLALGINSDGVAGHTHRAVTRKNDRYVDIFIHDVENILSLIGDQSTLLITGRSFLKGDNLAEIDDLLHGIIEESGLDISILSVEGDSSNDEVLNNPYTGFIYIPKWLTKSNENLVYLIKFKSGIVDEILESISEKANKET